ncbi:MAG TPA: hypothetical protein VKQ28_14595 [Candidatus Acidoferrum sp.]|nr:hypothetical protein [Candidatus Acidoferrum sp.]
MTTDLSNVVELAVTELIWDQTLYPRQQISEMHVNRIADAIRAGEALPHIVVDGKTKRIVDGTHRWKGWRKIFGDDSKIRCELREYGSDAEMYLAAIELNSAHGLDLSSFERTKCLLRMQELGIERETGLRALRMTEERAERMMSGRTAFRSLPGGGTEPVAIKAAMYSFRGQTLTKKQMAVNNYSGGMKASYYVDLVSGLVEAGICKDAPSELLRRLAKLRDLLNAALPGRRRKAS